MPRPSGPTRDTRERILNAAMELFASRGYAATTVKDIAKAVGIKDASLYNHFPSKQAIFDAIIERELARIRELFPNGSTPSTLPVAPAAHTARANALSAHSEAENDNLDRIIFDRYRPFFADARLICLRKMLTVNQFENSQAEKLFQTIFIEQPLSEQTALFDRMVSEGIFEQCNTRLAAYEFHSVAFLLLFQNLSWSEAMPSLRAHARAFSRAHSRKTLQ